MTLRCLALVTALSTAGFLSAQGTLKRGVYEDPERGFKVGVPPKWSQVPTQAGRKWVVAQFQSPKEYEGHHKLDDSFLHKPLMRVILFDHKEIKQRYEAAKAAKDAKAEKGEKGEKGETEKVSMELPYKDYTDYCTRSLKKGTWHVDLKQTAREGDLQVTRFQIKVEKLVKGRLRFVCWVFHGLEADFAVEFEFLEHHADKLESEALGALRGFRFLPRTKDAAAEGEVARAAPKVWSRDEWKKLPLEERFKRRLLMEKHLAKKATDSLPMGWTVQETVSFYVLTHAQRKYTRRITGAAEACRVWLDKRFGHVTDEYVMKGILRICKDYDEHSLFRKGGTSKGAFSLEDRELLTYEDRDEGNAGLNYGTLFYGLYNQYMHDKDEYLCEYLPVWLHEGLREYFYTAILKGRKLVFRADDEEKEAFHDLRRRDGVKSARELMTMTNAAYESGNRGKLHIDEQFANLLRFLEGRGRRHKLFRGRDFILEYMQESIRAAEKYNDGETEASGDRRTAVMKMVNAKLCNWSDKEWDSLNKAYAWFCK